MADNTAKQFVKFNLETYSREWDVCGDRASSSTLAIEAEVSVPLPLPSLLILGNDLHLDENSYSLT